MNREVFEALHRLSNKNLRTISQEMDIPFRRMCHQFKIRCLNKDGSFFNPMAYTDKVKEFLVFCASNHTNIKDMALLHNETRERISSIYSSANIQVKWKLEDNHNDLLAASRRAELFVKNIGYRVVRDTYTCASSQGQKAPFDLILEKWGSVDVKSTVLKLDKYGNTYAAFNVQNFTKKVKYAFLVAMDENRDDFIAVFAVPSKAVFGRSTIHITLSPKISPKYAKYLIWRHDEQQ